MAARIVDGDKKFIKLSYREITLGTLLTLFIGAASFAFTAGAQVTALKNELSSKAGRYIVDSIAREVDKKAPLDRLDRIENRLDELKFVVCIDHKEQAVCR